MLQVYDFDIIYREGKSMEHADCLSRNHLPEIATVENCSGKFEASPSSTPVKKTVKFVELHASWLSVEQKRDAEI